MTDTEALQVDYCPTHKSLFPPMNRTECDAKSGWLVNDWSHDDSQMGRQCEWWVGKLIELRPVRISKRIGK